MGSKRKRAAKEAGQNETLPSQKRLKNAPEQANGSTKTKPSKALDKSPFTEHPTVQDRKRELELYELLGSEDGAERITAADAIISGLLGGDGVAEPVLVRHLDKRLFRGLASGRNASRLGFSLVLTEILGQLFGEKDLATEKYPGLNFDKVLGILIEKTQAGGNIPGQEERDRYFGQLFGVECFVRSGILFSDKRRWLAVLDLLLSLASKKSWLKSQCGYVVVQAIAGMKKKLAEKTLEKLVEQGFAKTPEGVGIWIAALDRFPDMQVPAQPWRNPLASASLQALPPVLKDSGREPTTEQGNKPKQGSWSAQLHFVWDLILAHFLKLAKEQPEAVDEFKVFWKRIVDEGFFSKTSSDSQKFSGFMIFQKMLEGTVEFPQMVTALFSQNFVGCLMNQAAREDRYLHRAALKALKSIEVTVEHHPEILPTILRQLLSEHGVYNFDQRTNTKTVDKLLQQTTPATVKAVVKLLKLKDSSKSGLDEEKYYQALGNYLGRLASASSESSAASSKSVPGTAIQLLTELAYSNDSVPASVKESLRTKCTSSFAKLARRPEDFGDLCGAILSIDVEKGEEDDETAWAAMLQAYERLKELLDPTNDTDSNRAQRQALALLHAVGILQFHNRDPDAMNQLEELETCYEKLSKQEGVSEFLVEILLAMLSRPSALMRQVSQQVFEAFTPLISEEALHLLTDPLETDESEKGQQALFSTEDEDMADADAGSDDGSDEEELDSDVEIVDLEEAGSEAPEDSDNDSDDEEEEKKEAGEKNPDQEALDALDNALAEVLNSHRLDKDADAISSDDGSDMSDSEMMEVDAKLVEIFKQRAKTTSKKKEKKEAKDTVVNFKHRILDLLAIYVKKEAAVLNPLAFETLLPLLQLIRTTTAKPLANKACESILNFSKSLKKARSSHVENDDINAEQLTELLKEIHHEASQDPSHAFAKAVSTASLSVASVLCANKETRDGVFELYAQTQLKWFEGSVKIQQSFFADWLQWCQSHASAAAAAGAED
ncbi:DNA polymerase phi-domain-containing protein [Cercophora newfieldiana]|uniref:DNA polymerase phi-domain-containing protein n=1 Tax=Cercophora newfieldiana TaxID=92897 RepID=A0AA40D0C5_9PEZI|nr:DNA polymerase phi-domain-containing protein [Cercophora newfieldiana]